jgi:vancomycin resistance protein VanW
VEFFRAARALSDLASREHFAHTHEADIASFPHLVFRHQARLIREYPEPWYSLQQNKIENLRIAASRINGIVIEPGMSFSFWRVIGRTSASKGYKPGMTILNGALSSSIGGGLCQLSNALYWVALHTGCTITERHRHSFDCFPDSYRTVPFGAGATVFYNYVDFRFRNDTDNAIFIRTFLDHEYLHLAAYEEREPRDTYRIVEENHTFSGEKPIITRENDLYRLRMKGDEIVDKEHIAHNRGRVLYDIGRRQ